MVSIIPCLTPLGRTGVFVLIMAAIPVFSVADNDRITLTKIIVVIISGGGAALVGLSQVTGNETLTGPEFLGLAICYSTLGAFLYVHCRGCCVLAHLHNVHTYILYVQDRLEPSYVHTLHY